MKNNDSVRSIRKIGWSMPRCNMGCDHCYNASHARLPVLSPPRMIEVADKVCPEAGDINFGTGEFAVNPGASELVEYIRRTYPHVSLSLTSNGYTVVALGERNADLWHDVDISVDFAEPERHNAFRRHGRAWEWVTQALAILRELGIPRTIVACMTARHTTEDAVRLAELAQAHGAFLRVNWYRHTGRGTSDLRLSARQAWERLEALLQVCEVVSLESIFAAPLGLPCEPCPAGEWSCRIQADGSVTAYPFLKGERWSGGNILSPGMSLQAVRESPVFARLRRRTASVLPECAECPFQAQCRGGCVTRAILHNGDVERTDDYCPVAGGALDIVERLRARARLSATAARQALVHEGYLCTTILQPA